MEFKYRAGQNQNTPSPTPRPLPTVAYVNSDISRHSLQGCEFPQGCFPGNASMPTIFPTQVSINAEEAFQRQLEKEKIRREIMANEMALVRRRELEEEVRREMASERALGIPMQRPEGILVPQGVSKSNFNPRIGNNITMFGGPQSQLPHEVDSKKPYTTTHIRQSQSSKDRVIILAKPDVDQYGGKRKATTPPAFDDNEHSSCNLQKTPGKVLSCALCQVAATSEKALNDHLQGKRHKAKLRRIPKNLENIN